MTENYTVDGQISIFDLDTWCGKTSPEHSVATKEKTSRRSSRKSQGSQNRNAPMCLCLKKENGQNQESSTMTWGGWSVAWRVHDAQFWGVPQRRKRIALVADFGGLSAAEVLFERKGLHRDSEQSRAEREGTPGSIEDGTGESDEGIIYV